MFEYAIGTLLIAKQLSHESVLHPCSCFSIPDEDEDSNPTSTSLDEEVLFSSDSSSTSEDMHAAADVLLNAGDFEYEDDEEDMSFDDEESSDDEEGVRRRYLRANANGMGRRLTRYKCKSSCMNKCRLGRSMCKKRCCRPAGAGQASASGGKKPRVNGMLGTNPHIGGWPPVMPPPAIPNWPPVIPPVTSPQLPYCPNGSMHTTGMGPCMATQTPIPGVNACPSGTVGTYGPWNTQCVVW